MKFVKWNRSKHPNGRLSRNTPPAYRPLNRRAVQSAVNELNTSVNIEMGIIIPNSNTQVAVNMSAILLTDNVHFDEGNCQPKT